MMWGQVFQWLLAGIVCGLALLWAVQGLMRQLGALRGRARRLGRHRGLHCVEPVNIVFDPQRDA